MRLPLLIFLFVWAVSLKAQVNLVPNPSFEEVTDCPFSGGQIDGVTSWTSVFGSVDYYNECGTNGYGIPLSWGGWQHARTGQAYLGIAVWSLGVSNGHEFVGVYLTDSLVNGRRYNVEFNINMSDSNWYAVRNIGAYFSQTQPSPNINSLFNVEPQVSYTDSIFLIDKKDWTKIQGSFIAQGGEKFITIGNFDSDSETDTLFVDSGAVYRPTMPHYWTNSGYFIDDVSVTLDTTTGISETEKPKLKIYPNPAGNQITIEQLSVTGNQLSVEVYDAVGRLVTLSVVEGQTSTIPLNLSKGVYLLRVKEKEEVVFWEKVIIQ